MQSTVSNRNASKRVFYPIDALIPREEFLTKQGKQVLDLMRRDGRVTRMTALHYGVANLTARIAELRVEGYAVDCSVKLDANGKEYGVWTLKAAA